MVAASLSWFIHRHKRTQIDLAGHRKALISTDWERREGEKEKRSGNYDAGLPSFSLSISGDLLETGECQLCALCVTDCGFTYKDIPAKKVHNRHESSKGAKSLCVMRDMWLASGSIPFNFLSFFWRPRDFCSASSWEEGEKRCLRAREGNVCFSCVDRKNSPEKEIIECDDNQGYFGPCKTISPWLLLVGRAERGWSLYGGQRETLFVVASARARFLVTPDRTKKAPAGTRGRAILSRESLILDIKVEDIRGIAKVHHKCNER